MGENIIATRQQVRQKIDSVLREKAVKLDVWKAVYFNVVFDYRDVAVVNPWEIGPISDKFLCYGDFRSTLISYLNAEIGAIANQIREAGFIDRPECIYYDTYAVAISGQLIGSDIFLSGICSENGPDAKRLKSILSISDEYSPTGDYLDLERYDTC